MKKNNRFKRPLRSPRLNVASLKPPVRACREISTRQVGAFALFATLFFAPEATFAQDGASPRLPIQATTAPRYVDAVENADSAQASANVENSLNAPSVASSEISEIVGIPDADKTAADAPSSFLELVKKSELGGALVFAAQVSNTGGSGFDGGGKFDIDWTLPIDATNKLFLEVQANVGYGLDGRVSTFSGLNSCTSYDGTKEFYINELWYEKDWSGGEGRFRTQIGYLDLTNDFDTNAYANDEVTQFMAANFVNSITFDCPGNGLGAYAWWTPNEQYDFGFGYCETSDDGLELFSNGVLIAEIDRHIDWGGRKGTYRVNVWSNFTEYDDLVGTGKSTNFGWGVSLDQELTEKFGVFSRFGMQNGDCCSNEHSFTVGFETRDFNPNRPDDRIGFGYGRTFLSDAHRSAAEHGLATGTEDENNIEIYYSFALRDNFALTPSFQWVGSPAGDGDADSIFAPGLRANFEY